MDAEKIVSALSSKYPDKNIVLLPPENPTEIICEVEPTSEHPDYSTAIAVIDRSEPHHHKLSRETYTVLRGKLMLKLASKEIVLHPGIDFVIPPNTVHSAEADAAWVKVTSRPGWTPEDYILAREQGTPAQAPELSPGSHHREEFLERINQAKQSQERQP